MNHALQNDYTSLDLQNESKTEQQVSCGTDLHLDRLIDYSDKWFLCGVGGGRYFLQCLHGTAG